MKRPPRQSQSRGLDGMNATERRFSQYLDLLVKCGEIRDRTGFEPVNLILAEGKRNGKAWRMKYTPDFKAIDKDGAIYYDVKGTKKNGLPYITETAILRIKAAAARYLFARFRVVWEVRGQWYSQEFTGV